MVNPGNPQPLGSAGSGIGGISGPDMQQPGQNRRGGLGLPSGSISGAGHIG